MKLIALGILASGRGSNLQAIIDNVESGKLDARIACVISDVESAKALERAKLHKIEALFLNPEGKSKDDYFSEISGELKKRNVGLVVLAGFMRVLPPSFIREFENKIINIHPSLLPDFPGLHAQRQALEAKAKESGCTVHFVTPAIDAGPTILQAKVPVLAGDDEEKLRERILEQEHKLLPKAIQLIAENRISIQGNNVLVNLDGFEDKWA